MACSFFSVKHCVITKRNRIHHLIELTMEEDLLIFSHENLLKQTQHSELILGYHTVHFYVDSPGVPSKHITNSIEKFYLSPSGGTLRDSSMNIVMYSAKYDKYKGYGKA